jgi:hypothetical protein
MTSKRPATPFYDEAPTKLQALVGQLQKTMTVDSFGGVHAISVRMPTMPYTAIQALSQHSGISMNKLIVSLIDVALDQVWEQLGEEDQERVSELRSGYINLVMQASTPSQAGKGEI